jgi:hypothetical protein
MSGWMDEIAVERRRAEESKHPGRIRTAARRIAGIALRQLPDARLNSSGGEDYVGILRTSMNLPELSAEVREAASRLQSRLSADFSSPSKDPIGDAMIIVEYVKEVLRRGTPPVSESSP